MAPGNLYQEGIDVFKKNVQSHIRDSDDARDLDDFLKSQASPGDAQKSCNDLKVDAGRKFGDRKISDRVEIPAEWISNILSNISNFITIGDFVMKKAPESVGTAWFAVSFALTAIQSNYALYSLFGSGLTDLVDMMPIIAHYDRLYDKRSRPDFKSNEILTKLFTDIAETYAAMLDFSFSIRQHLSGGGWARIRHGFKDFFGQEGLKFQAKVDRIAAQKQKVIEASRGAFEAKTFQRFDEVQDVVESVLQNVQDVKRFQSTAEGFHRAQMQQLLRIENEVKAATRPRSRWEVAMDEFEKNKASLNPLSNISKKRDDLLNEKLDGTCEWLFERKFYDSWLASSESRMLCITGPEGAGKSVLLASISAKLEESLHHSIVLYLSCDMSSGEVDELSAQSLIRISNTLIFQLYEVATLDERRPGLLEDCNNVFRDPKSRKGLAARRNGRPGDTLPELTEAIPRLSAALGHKVVIVLDAVNRMNDKDQNELLNNLQGLSDERSCQILILVGVRDGTNFYNRIAMEGHRAGVELFNKPDIKKVVETELNRLPQWTAAQREQAIEKIMDKAGPSIKYAAQVAVPFIREPFQGQLADRLAALPEGLGETYNQFLRTLAPNYLDLLRTALSWTLFSPRPIKVTEIMDVFSTVYLRDPGEDEVKAEESDVLSPFRNASEIQIQQLRDAAGPFLEIWNDYDYRYRRTQFDLKDVGQVRAFCFRPASTGASDTADAERFCAQCKARLHSLDALCFSEREGQLNLALTCIRHLCNRLFQARYPFDIFTEEGTDELVGDAPTETKQAGGPSMAGNTESTEPAVDRDGSDGQSNDEALEQDEVHDSDDSIDDEDRGEQAFDGHILKAAQTDQELDHTRFDSHLRYEFIYWHYHLRQAEAAYSREEKASSPLWTAMLDELDKFAFEHTTAFQQWQTMLFYRNNVTYSIKEPLPPLHIAAYLRLPSWTEHLIDRGESLTADIHGRNPLRTACLSGLDPTMLKLLLEHGAEPNVETDKRISPFHAYTSWTTPNVECTKLFLEHGADRTTVDKRYGRTIMHYFALTGDDPELLEILMNHDGTKGRPDINAKDHGGETPLHMLLSRREVPVALLEAFLEHGASPDIDDQLSQRPLQLASNWGDEKTMRILLPKVGDVNDDDNHGRTALHQAAQSGYVDCVRLLLDHGASVTRMDKHDRTPLFFACLGTSAETAELLLETLREKGVPAADINHATKRGRTPLRQAAAHGFTTVVRKLLDLIDQEGTETKNVADVHRGRTALHCAAFRGHVECVRALTEHGADITIQDKDASTALELSYTQWGLSAQSHFEEVIAMLIDIDPVAAVKDVELISTAAANGSKRILEKLHGYQADLKKPDRYGWTPLMLAKQFDRTEAEKFLTHQTAWAGALPSRWMDIPSNFQVTNEGRNLRSTTCNKQYCFSTDRPLPAGLSKYYFEVSTKRMTDVVNQPTWPQMAVGFCTHGASAVDYPGWEPSDRAPSARSWAYHGDDGGLAKSSTGEFLPDADRRYQAGDTVGCGIDIQSGRMWITRNGEMIDTDFFDDVRGRLFPLLGIRRHPVELETNFGTQDFVWQDEQVVTNKGDASNEEMVVSSPIV